MKYIFFLCILFCQIGCQESFIPKQKVPNDPDILIGKLDNGLTYYIKHHDNPKERANFYIAQKVGSILEEENQRGLAHFLEHMCFNGTKHFPGNTLVSELEKKGIGFGTNINAYTAFDETVYRLTDIPLIREGIIDTALLVLHDWSGFVLLNDQDIDDERGVIYEEWRTTTSSNLRMLDSVILPKIYPGSPYANRLPIGLMDVVLNFKHKELRDYYKKWYRPDLQAIIVVGDIDVKEIEQKIKQRFNDIPKPENPAVREYFKVEDNKEPIVAMATDPEASSSSIAIYWKKGFISAEERATKQFYKNSIIDALNCNMLNNRFSEIYNKPERPFDYASCQMTSFHISAYEQAYMLQALPIESNVTDALKGLLTEAYRMKQYGFTASEFKRAKKSYLKSVELSYSHKNSRKNGDFGKKITTLFLKGSPVPDIDWEYQMTKDLLSKIKLEEVNKRAANYISNDNMVIIGTLQYLKDAPIPSDDQIIAAVQENKNQALSPYIDKLVAEDLMEIIPKPGKIIKTENTLFGYTQWTLSNGAKVRFKDTDSEQDEVIIYGYSKGGRSLVDFNDLPSTYFKPRDHGVGNFSKNDLQKILAGKQVDFTKSLSDYSESVNGYSSLADIETLFQLAYMKIVEPRIDTEQFISDTSKILSWLRTRTIDPNAVFMDTTQQMKHRYNPRANISKNIEAMKKADVNKMHEIYNERFRNAADFTYFITGNINTDSLRYLVETYVGSLPSTGIEEEAVDFGDYPLSGKVKNHFYHPLETKKSMVNIYYSTPNEYTLEHEILDKYLSKILRTVLLETVREKEGGTYGVFTGGGWPCTTKNKLSGKHYNFRIAFDTDPDKLDKLLAIIYREIEKIKHEGPTKQQVQQVKDNLLKRHKEQIKENENSYWSNLATSEYVYGVNRGKPYETFISEVTPEMVHEYINLVLGTENIMEIIMTSKEI